MSEPKKHQQLKAFSRRFGFDIHCENLPAANAGANIKSTALPHQYCLTCRLANAKRFLGPGVIPDPIGGADGFLLAENSG
jgi:hypothetical protein